MEQIPAQEADSYSSSQKISTHYGTGNFIIVFARAHHCTPSWARWIQSTHSPTIPL